MATCVRPQAKKKEPIDPNASKMKLNAKKPLAAKIINQTKE
jgi:hypothetical protein